MKKVLALVLVLGLASLAHAGLVISVNGVADPCDSTITLQAPSGTAIIDISNNDPALPQNLGALVFIVRGPGILHGDGAVNIVNSAGGTASGLDPMEFGGFQGLPGSGTFFDFAPSLIPPPAFPVGKVGDGLVLHCEGLGDVVIALGDVGTGLILDTQIIHQIPEPLTLSLLSLGGLGLLRRRHA